LFEVPNRAYVEAARNTTDMINSHIEAMRAAMKAVAHEGAPTAMTAPGRRSTSKA
jgi:hypothetical protein